MRNDAGINGDAQRIEQMVWILFLKVYNAKEEEWELLDDHYKSVIPEKYRWSNWASDHKDGKALTGEALLNFVNNELFPALKNLEIDETTPMSKIIVKSAFEDNNNYMKDGILLRQVINIIDGFDKAKWYTAREFANRNYNIDLCGFPHEEEEILPPHELIRQYQEKRASLNAEIDRILAEIERILVVEL